MPKIVEHFKDDLILCSRCKRYLPRESFFEWLLRKHKYECKECHRKAVNEFNHRHGVKTREEQGKEQEQNRQKELEKRLLEDPFEEINEMVERVVKKREEYKIKEGHVCGYCDSQSTVGMNGKNYCWKHWLIESLSMGKPLAKNSHSNSPEFVRKTRILKELEGLGVQI